MLLKAKFESVALGLTTFEQEFLAAIVLTNGQTVGQKILSAFESGDTNFALPARGESGR